MIVTADPRRRAWSPSDTSRKHLPAAISISSMYLPAALTASTAVKVLQERWFEQLNDMTLVGTSESGYITDELALEWVQHFERLTRPATKDSWCSSRFVCSEP